MNMQFKNENICAIIPVRAGSKRVVNKNIRSFAGSNLLQRKINQLKAVSKIEAIYVSSDSPEMLEIAETSGCVAIERPAEFALDLVPMSEVYKHLGELVKEPIVLFTHVTTPLCGEASYRAAISQFLNLKDEYDSLTTVTNVKDFLYWDGEAVNFDPKSKPRSQDLPNIVKLNHAISIAPRELMIQEKNIFGHCPFLMPLTDFEAFDIDTELDFEIAEYLATRL
ncbi:acylneuraminate cytidylyltransferase family protein [Akkermansiaceae bacterium]|nr:acylneuraminate cytidylyltransferase family protein [Akkermansiaceae bacterium]MDB4695340.1 acylneuraminate cytidylyltransferase family protein [Akkermansiaceae bacterium]